VGSPSFATDDLAQLTATATPMATTTTIVKHPIPATRPAICQPLSFFFIALLDLSR
jgi:hypothetical protein